MRLLVIVAMVALVAILAGAVYESKPGPFSPLAFHGETTDVSGMPHEEMQKHASTP